MNPEQPVSAEQKNPLIIEIGSGSVGSDMFFDTLREKIAEGARYIAIDCSQEELRDQKKQVKKSLLVILVDYR